MKLTSTTPFVQLALTLSTFSIRLTSARPTDALSIQAGYHVIWSYPGVTPPAQLLDFTQQGLVGGIILFGENIDNKLNATIASFQAAYLQSPGNCGKPLFIMTDQEGGLVRRLPGGPALSEKKVGLSSDPTKAAILAGTQASQALQSQTVNTNLAPVLGVFRKPGDFLDNFQRSYGNTSQLVAQCAGPFITSHQASGVITTAKHFPGLGAAGTNENTDAVPVTINLSLNELRTIDQAPYVGAIAAGVKMVMPSWAFYPALDAKRPSGLSSLIIQGELRGRLGFKGVTVSDAIEAGGLVAFGDDANRSVLASQAGMDVILASGRNATQGVAIVNAIVAALHNGSLPQAAFDAATQRIIALRGQIPA